MARGGRGGEKWRLGDFAGRRGVLLRPGFEKHSDGADASGLVGFEADAVSVDEVVYEGVLSSALGGSAVGVDDVLEGASAGDVGVDSSGEGTNGLSDGVNGVLAKVHDDGGERVLLQLELEAEGLIEDEGESVVGAIGVGSGLEPGAERGAGTKVLGRGAKLLRRHGESGRAEAVGQGLERTRRADLEAGEFAGARVQDLT